MGGLLRLSRGIDEFNRRLSRVAVWLVLFAALLSACNAFFRYFINEIIHLAKRYERMSVLQDLLNWYGANSNAFLEAQWYMFAYIAMFGAAYTLKVNEHVRVDLIYGTVSRAHAHLDRSARRHLLPAADVRRADLLDLAVVHRRLAQRRGLDQRRRAGALAGQAHHAAWASRWSCCRAFPRSSSASPR